MASSSSKRAGETGRPNERTGETSDERRVDVTITVDASGKRHVVVRDMSYGRGVGWYPQKTIHLDQRQIDALMGKLCACRQIASKLDSDAEEAGGGTRPAEIVTFPR